MSERRCYYCGQEFQPSRCHPEQAVCSQFTCQRRRRADNRKQKLIADPEYRDVCRESARKWRADHTGSSTALSTHNRWNGTVWDNASGIAASSCSILQTTTRLWT
jgi:hypothetical protein